MSVYVCMYLPTAITLQGLKLELDVINGAFTHQSNRPFGDKVHSEDKPLCHRFIGLRASCIGGQGMGRGIVSLEMVWSKDQKALHAYYTPSSCATTHLEA